VVSGDGGTSRAAGFIPAVPKRTKTAELFVSVTAWQTWAYDRKRPLLRPQNEKLVLRIGVRRVAEMIYKCQEKHSSFSPDLIPGGERREASRALQKTYNGTKCRERPFFRTHKSRQAKNN
jgi:hypothetical protein